MPLQNITQAAASRLSFLYNIKIWVRLVATIAAMLCLAWGIMIFWTAQQQREFALHQAHDLAMSVHQMTMANLLFMKVTKTIKKRHVYYSQVRQSAAVKDLRILRGPVVVHEMGDGDEIAMNPTEIEKKVIESGRTVFEEIEDPQHGHVLLAIFPATAAKNYLGRDCMECHEEAKEGQILGAVSMKISLVDLDRAVADSRLGMITATVMITVPLLAFIFIFVRSFVTNPLAAMGGNLQGIAGGAGDLTSRLPVRGKDEIGEVSAAFNAMMTKLQKLIIRINETSHHVSAAAREQSAQSEKIAAGSDKQTRKSAQAAQSLDEIAASIASVTEACGRVQALSQESRERTTAGMASLDDFSQKIRQVETAVSQIAATVEQFVTNTESIIKMTQEVKDIAGMTNLLALNAAIEAARAGEQGRGFAVVADEVRKLAEKSTRSATEIDAITRALAGESAEVRVAIRDGLEILGSSHASMANVANVLQEASGVVNRVAEGMNDILAATREQAVASSEISEQVEAISGQASENGQAIAAMKFSSQQLSSLAQSLEEELGRFKT